MKLLFVITASISANDLYSQSENDKLGIIDEWYRKIGSKGLQVGDTVPELQLGKILNNTSYKNKLSDFRDKLLILDFWDSYCSTCIASFPHMENLQREFDGKIQILLVNLRETQEQIEERFAKYFNGKFKLPDLPCVVADSFYEFEELDKSPLFRLFPSRGFPHHVWIDQNGIVRLRGDAKNTYASKIRDLLEGKEIFVLNSSATIPSIVGANALPYYSLLGNFKSTRPRMASIITPYNNEIDAGSGIYRQIVDSINMAVTTQFINYDLLDIYMRGPFRHIVEKFSMEGNILYSPTPIAGVDFVILPADIDSLQYSSRSYITKRKLTDIEFIKSKFCFEQVMPLDLPEAERKNNMLIVLNQYFGHLYGFVASIEKRLIPYYSLIRTSTIDKTNSIKTINREPKINTSNINGHLTTSFVNISIGTVIRSLFDQNERFESQFIYNKSQNLPFLLVNDTGWDPNAKKVEIVVRNQRINSVADLRNELQAYDLDIVENKMNVEFIVFKKKSADALVESDTK